MSNFHKILFVGDSHGHLDHIEYVINVARSFHVQAIVHVGDFGFLGNPTLLRRINTFLTDANISLYTLTGNHDERTTEVIKPNYPCDFLRIIDKISVIPDGHSWTWSDVTFMGLGGAHTPGTDDKWDVEVPQPKSVNQALKTRCQILVTHDSFIGNPRDYYSSKSNGVDMTKFSRTDHTNIERGETYVPTIITSLLNRMEMEASLNVCGHWHKSYFMRHGGTQIVGLAAFDSPDDSYLFLDLHRYYPMMKDERMRINERNVFTEEAYRSRTTHLT